MFDVNGGELLVIVLVVVLVVGPERLPHYAAQLAALVRGARGQLRTVQARVADELGDDVTAVDWAALDPRQYDPRRIVRDALLDDRPVPSAAPRLRREPPPSDTATP